MKVKKKQRHTTNKKPNMYLDIFNKMWECENVPSHLLVAALSLYPLKHRQKYVPSWFKQFPLPHIPCRREHSSISMTTKETYRIYFNFSAVSVLIWILLTLIYYWWRNTENTFLCRRASIIVTFLSQGLNQTNDQLN